MLRPPIRVAGIVPDTKGWISVELRDRHFRHATHQDTLVRVIIGLGSAAVIAVAAPLGLPAHQIRAADSATAHLLRRHSTTPLPAPPAAALNAPNQPAAAKLCRQTAGFALNTKAWAARHHLLQAHDLWRQHPRLMHEAHPELTYAQLNGAPLTTGPDTWRSHNAFLHLLDSQGIVVPDDLGAAGNASATAVLGAAMIALTAHRIATATALSYPDPPEQVDGAAIAIWT